MNTHTPSHGGLPAPSPKSGDAAQPAPLSPEPPQVICDDFFTHERAYEAYRCARTLQHAWAMAVVYRCPKAYRQHLRNRMREYAVAAVRFARIEASHRPRRHAA